MSRKPQKGFEENAIKLNAGDFSTRSKAKAKPQQRDSASSSTRTVLIREWTDVEPGKHSFSDYPVSKKMVLFRHGHPLGEEDGAIEFWRLKGLLQDHFVFCH